MDNITVERKELAHYHGARYYGKRGKLLTKKLRDSSCDVTRKP